MIISDEHKFVFVHIPKCAGTSVRRALRPVDTTGGRFEPIGEHPAIGRIHYAHITLRDLAAHFPEEFDKVRHYRSLAVVRDPIDRFYSAIFQRLREFRGYGQSQITLELIDAEAIEVRRYLETVPERLALEYVHFNRQADFVELDGERVVGELFATSRLADARNFIADATGVNIGEERKNRTTEISFKPLKPVQRLLRRPYARLLSAERRRDIRERMTKAGFYKDIPKQRFVRRGSPTEDFVRSYYARDFVLHLENQ